MKNIPNSVCPTPNGHSLPVGSLNLFLYKAKLIVRWGRKATGLEIR